MVDDYCFHFYLTYFYDFKFGKYFHAYFLHKCQSTKYIKSQKAFGIQTSVSIRLGWCSHMYVQGKKKKIQNNCNSVIHFFHHCNFMLYSEDTNGLGYQHHIMYDVQPVFAIFIFKTFFLIICSDLGWQIYTPRLSKKKKKNNNRHSTFPALFWSFAMEIIIMLHLKYLNIVVADPINTVFWYSV